MVYFANSPDIFIQQKCRVCGTSYKESVLKYLKRGKFGIDINV